MANPEHLEVLKQGMKVWNEWIENNQNSLDLDYATIESPKVDLRGPGKKISIDQIGD